MLNVSEKFRRRLAQTTAPPMFCLAFLFLVLVATLVVLWVDVPMMITPHEGESMDRPVTENQRNINSWISAQTALETGYDLLTVLYLLWPVFWVEFLLQYFYRDRQRPFWRQRYAGLIACLCPPLRMCTRHYDMQGKLWLPAIGWQEVDFALRERLERLFSVPMIFIALTIVPVLLVDVGMKHQVMARPWLQVLLHVSMGLIWLAFAAEFIVMVSVAEKKLKYCKEHWLDIAIILLPVISFLRSLRIIRATRLARIAKVQQLSKMGRLYRLRGLVMRALRALMILELLDRVFRVGPERRLKKLRALLQEKETEIAVLRRHIAALELKIEEQKRAEERPEMEIQDEQCTMPNAK